MVKKILYSLLVFISAFIFVGDVNAYVTNHTVTSVTINENLKGIFNRSFPSVQETNLEAINNGILEEYGDYYFCVANVSWSSMDCYVTNNINDIGMSFDQDGRISFFHSYRGKDTFYKLNLKSGLINSTSTVTTVENYTSIGGSSESYVQVTNMPYFIFLRIDDIYSEVSQINTGDGYSFNRDDILIYNDNGTFILNTEYKTVDEIMQKGEFYSLSSIAYSAIEVRFHINDFPMIDEGNNINLEYEINLQNEMIIPVLPIPQEKIYRTIAPEEYTLGTTVNLLYDEKTNIYSYKGKKHYDYWNTITYRFEFPFLGDYIGNVNFKFWSDSPYTIILEERTNEENDIKYTELDLTGKYGVGFIPKIQTIEFYEEFYGIFKIPMQNNYKLLFYKDYNLIKNNNKNNLLEDKVLLSLEKFEYLFTRENKNSYLLFVNNNFENGTNASIYYNSNYFNYCILDESISSCNIINPNTNEETNINTNLSDVDSFKIANVFDTFLSFSSSTNFILENVTHFYNDYLPSELKAFFYISFGFVVIIIITKIVL